MIRIKNFIEVFTQRKPHYDIKPESFRIDVYIAFDRTVVIIGQKDNNFTEWLSVGRLTQDEIGIGACINELVKNTPLPVTASLYWKPFEEQTGIKYEDLKVFYLHVRITKDMDRHLIINGKQILGSSSEEDIQQLFWELYNQEITKMAATEELSTAGIVKELKKDFQEIKKLEEECPEPWALHLVADEAEKVFKAKQAKYLYSQDIEV